MALTDLTEVEIFQGSFALLIIIIDMSIGLKIASKYFKYKRKELLTLGLAIIFLGSIYTASSFSFVNYILFEFSFDIRLYLFLNVAFTPFGLIFWLYSFFHLFSRFFKKTQILILSSVLVILWDVFFIYFLILDPSIVGTMEGRFNVTYGIYVILYSISLVIACLTVSILYYLQCQKSDDLEIKWRGRFILLGILTFTLGIILDIFATDPITIILARLMIIIFGIEWYVGWIMPKSIAKRLIKSDIYVKKESKEKKAEFEEFMKLLKTKPETITEEEVIFHREKKICLVCKGNVSGFNTFICINCDALYCQNCARHLSNLENQCWVCDAPFDESKPTKLFSKEKEELSIKKKLDKNFKEI